MSSPAITANDLPFAREEGPEVGFTISIILYGQGKTRMVFTRCIRHEHSNHSTLAELVVRIGQIYEAMVPSSFNQGNFVFNHRLWMDINGIYLENEQMQQEYAKYMKIMRELAAWRLKYGDSITN